MPFYPAMVIIGPTGSGKTPLGDLCEAKPLWGFRGVHFDFGVQLRRVEKTGAVPVGLTADEIRVIQDALRTGKLLENEHFPIAEKILVSFLEEKRVRQKDILVLNGLPRHVGQASDLDAVVDIRLLVFLDCRPESVCQRIARNTGGDRTGRNDDAGDAVERRLAVFRERTLPLLEHYRNRGAAVEIMPVEARTRPSALYGRLNRKAYRHLWESSQAMRFIHSIRTEEQNMDCNKDKNMSRCNCTYDPCPRKGICCECLTYHLKMRQLPGCCFPDDAEKTYDRSFAHFARLVQEKKV